MQVTLTFDLPEEQEAHQLALDGPALHSAALDFDNYLRNKIKYEQLTNDQHAIYSTLRLQFHEYFDGLLE